MKMTTICAGLLALACVLPLRAADVRAKQFDAPPGVPLARDRDVALDSPLQAQSVDAIVSAL